MQSSAKGRLVGRLVKTACLWGRGNSEAQRKPGGLMHKFDTRELAELTSDDFQDVRCEDLIDARQSRIWRIS